MRPLAPIGHAARRHGLARRIECTVTGNSDLLEEEPDAEKLAALRAAEALGDRSARDAFLDWLAALVGRNSRPGTMARRQVGAES
jgi:hypothetical protein